MPSDRPGTDGFGALAGVRVIEVGQMIAGPFAGHLLADHGADVIKVESQDGDVMRGWGAQYKGLGLFWPAISRNKRSVTLDLRTTRGQSLLRALAATADVLIENFRPGTMEAWGLGPSELWQANPRLIIARVSGYGQTGPYSKRAGFGAIGEAMGGIRHLTGEPGRLPVRMGISLGDALAATQGVIGVLLALYARVAGRAAGQMIDVAIYEAVWAYMESTIGDYDKLGLVREPTGARLAGVAPSSVYPTADGIWVLIAANRDTVFRRLALAMGSPDLAWDPQYQTHEARGRHQNELDDLITRWSIGEDSSELLKTLDEHGVPAGRIYTAADIASDPHYQAREMIVHVRNDLIEEDVAMPGIVPKLSSTPGLVRTGGPLLGEHNVEVFVSELGIPMQEYEDLVRSRII